jgi:hypothetical protein
LRQQDRRFFILFGIPFIVVMTWTVHSTGSPVIPSWMPFLIPLSLLGFYATFGGIFRSSYSGLTRLTTLNRSREIELDEADQTPPPPGQEWTRLFGGTANRVLRRFPKDCIIAVQACPWNLIIGSSGDEINAVALQGILVIKADPTGAYERIPLMPLQAIVDHGERHGSPQGALPNERDHGMVKPFLHP